MTDDQQLIAELEDAIADYGRIFRVPYALAPNLQFASRLAAALSAAAVRNAELQEIFDGGYGEFEESIKDREAKRYRAAIGNWRAAALKAEAELATAAVRYRAEGIERAAEVAASSTVPLRRGWDLNTGSRSQWYANGVRDAAARVRALLDENNETQEN